MACTGKLILELLLFFGINFDNIFKQISLLNTCKISVDKKITWEL